MLRLLKTQACRAIAATGLDTWLGVATGALVRPWTVGYHSVVEDKSQMADLMPGLAITTETLGKHLDWMSERFELVALDDIDELAARRAPWKKPLAAITFDDGYRGVFEHAFPLMKKRGIPGSLFVVSDRIGAEEPLAHDQVYRSLRKRRTAEEAHEATRVLLHALTPHEIEQVAQQLHEPGKPNQLELTVTWPMILELKAAGWTIGSHTRTHARLVTCTAQELIDEVEGSRQVLEEGLGSPVRTFAYPDGAFDPAAVDAVRKAGYRLAYTTCAHRDARYPALSLPRTMLWEGSSMDASGDFSPAILACQSSGLLELLSGCRADHGMPASS